jgi:hypothetical protein
MSEQRDTQARSRFIVAVRKQYYLLACVCMLARARMWVPRRVGVCMRISACSPANPARRVYGQYCDIICGPSVFTIFFDIIS